MTRRRFRVQRKLQNRGFIKKREEKNPDKTAHFSTLEKVLVLHFYDLHPPYRKDPQLQEDPSGHQFGNGTPWALLPETLNGQKHQYRPCSQESATNDVQCIYKLLPQRKNVYISLCFDFVKCI